MKDKKPTSSPRFSLDLTTIILAILMLVIPITFFFLLNQQEGTGFGFSEISFSILFAVVVTAFLNWIKSLMVTRPYLGLIVGLAALVSFEYSLFFNYIGSYTVIFAILTAILILIYLGIHFIRNRKNSGKIHDDFDDNLSKPKN